MSDLAIGNALVLGLGKVTGKAVAISLVELGAEVRVSEIDPKPHQETARYLRELGVQVDFAQPSDELLDWADLVIPAPGVPPSNSFLQKAQRRGLRIWSEIELGARLCNGHLICITGTNGKTTTTALIAAILGHGGRPAVACGNIGFTLVEAVRTSAPGSYYVCEVSSFQLAFIESLAPKVALILNIAEDHADWHGSADAYAAAKAKITQNQTGQDLLVVRAGDRRSAGIASASSAALGVFGLGSAGNVQRGFEREAGRRAQVVAGIDRGRVFFRTDDKEYAICDVSDIPLVGRANQENVVAAALVAAHLGVDDEKIQKAVNDYEPLPHRFESVAEVGGALYINDSKATNPHAALSAMQGLSRVILIAGGRAKGVDLSPLSQAASSLKAVVVMGEAAGELIGIFGEAFCVKVLDVEEAVRAAADLAEPGDTVLLSPGCSSLDQYRDYAERGDRFKKAVRQLGHRS